MEDFNIISEKVKDPKALVFSIDQVVATQMRKTEKAKLHIPCEKPDDVVKAIGEVLAELKTLKCNICGLPGHQSPYCWVNGQVWALCRQKGEDAQRANFLWRESIKLRRQGREEAFKLEMATIKAAQKTAFRVNTKTFRISKHKGKIIDATKYAIDAMRKGTNAQVAKQAGYFA